MVFEAYDAWWYELRGLANECFRGGLKTTIMSNWFMSYQVALYPKDSNLLIQDDGPKAQLNAEAVALIIETNPYFKWFFPHIEPDYKKGWGDKGYEIKRTDMDYADWRRLTSKRRDPSFVGAGYSFGFVLGMHPTRMLIIDDINNEKNTKSARTLSGVISTWEDKILPTAIEGQTWELYNFTPWVPGDVGDRVKGSPEFYRSISTPVCTNGDITKPIWPEKYPTHILARLIQKYAPATWARMFLVDPSAAEGTLLLREWLHYYPFDQIEEEWPTVFGVDYASVKSIQDTQGHDEYALAVLKLIPGGGLVLYDGIKQHMTQVMAEESVQAYNSWYQPQRIGVEELGVGKEFYYRMLKIPGLKLRGQKVQNRSKRMRFEKAMGPVFARGAVMIAGNPQGTGVYPGRPFLQQFIDEWVQWEGDGKYGDDCMDGVYHAILCARRNLIEDQYKEELLPSEQRKKRKRHPYLGFLRRGQ